MSSTGEGVSDGLSSANARAVQRAQAQELPTDILIAELERRGYEIDVPTDIVLKMPPVRTYTLDVEITSVRAGSFVLPFEVPADGE